MTPYCDDLRGHVLSDLMRHPAETVYSSQSGQQLPTDLMADFFSATTYLNITDGFKPQKRNSTRKPQEVSASHGDKIETFDSMHEDQFRAWPTAQKEMKRSIGKSTEKYSKKQRGRPRLDTHDETAADRRRTQTRLAQRAYRQRKEITISGLQHCVKDLEQTVTQMNSSFVDLHDNIFDSGLLHARPALSSQLKHTSDEFSALSKLKAPESDGDDEATKITEMERSHILTESRYQAEQMQVEYPQYMLRDHNFSYTAPKSAVKHQVDLNFGPLENVSADKLLESILGELLCIDAVQQINTVVPAHIFRNDQTLRPDIDMLLKTSVPYTYSFQETTFAGRLHRLSLENAFRVLTNPSTDPEHIARAFRFTFTFSTKARMLILLQELLKRKAGESLEIWSAPFFRVGGAGTHFPRRDSMGRKVYPPNMLSAARTFGPRAFDLAETPRSETTVEQLVEAVGFGGVWFDAHDVEEYLQLKGIFLDGSSSFCEVYPVSLSTYPPFLSSSSTTSSMEYSSTPEYCPATPELVATLPNALKSSAQELPDPFGVDGFLPFGEEVTYSGGVPTTDWNYGFATPPSWASAPMTLDVNKLLERIVSGSACLGRAPGFRQKDVDSALRNALQEAF